MLSFCMHLSLPNKKRKLCISTKVSQRSSTVSYYISYIIRVVVVIINAIRTIRHYPLSTVIINTVITIVEICCQHRHLYARIYSSLTNSTSIRSITVGIRIIIIIIVVIISSLHPHHFLQLSLYCCLP